ncbi:MAG: hypothetical protein SGARI_003740 [Bacillariaceae sp.]
MVLTTQNNNYFFEDASQMNLPRDTRLQLAVEGIQTVSDLLDFDESTLEDVAKNLRYPPGRVADPLDANRSIPTPPFVVSAKSLKRLTAASELVRYYETIGRGLTAANIDWVVIRDFDTQWKALKERKDSDPPEVPKITKQCPILPWTESFPEFCQRKLGSRTIPLSYVIRDDVTVSATCPGIATGKPHSEEYGSVEAELVARASHTHSLYRDDNATVYHDLEVACRGTIYAATIKPFKRSRNGRGAWESLKNQYAGDDKYQLMIKSNDDILHSSTWKGQSNFTLEKFVAKHRNAYVTMEECALHVQFQLPSGYTRVNYLLDGIECADPGLQAAMAVIKNDDVKKNDFELASSYLLPFDPVAKKLNDKKRPNAEISAVKSAKSVKKARVASVSGSGKLSRGKTGVEFRFYRQEEYHTLSPEQKDELRLYRLAHPEEFESKKKKRTKAKSYGQSGGKPESSLAAVVSAAVKDHFESEKEAAVQKQQDDSAFRAYLMSLIGTSPGGQASSVKAKTPPTPISLHDILKRGKKGPP